MLQKLSLMDEYENFIKLILMEEFPQFQEEFILYSDQINVAEQNNQNISLSYHSKYAGTFDLNNVYEDARIYGHSKHYSHESPWE